MGSCVLLTGTILCGGGHLLGFAVESHHELCQAGLDARGVVVEALGTPLERPRVDNDDLAFGQEMAVQDGVLLNRFLPIGFGATQLAADLIPQHFR